MADNERTDAGENAESGAAHSGAQPAAAGLTGQPGPPDPGAPAAPGRPRRSRRRIAVAGAGAAVVIAALVIATVPTAPAQTPTQALVAALRASAKLRSESASMTEQVGRLGTIRATFHMQRKPLLESVTMTETGGGHSSPVSMILTTSAMYLKLGMLLPGLPRAATGKWIKIPLTGLGSNSLIAPLVQNATGQDPMSEVQMIAAGEHLRAVGPRTIAGVATTEYAGSYSPSAALRRLPGSSRAAAGGVLKLIRGDIEFRTWIDGNHQIRKLVQTETIDSLTVRLSISLYGFNQPLRITVPAASQVVGLPTGFVPGSA